MENKKKLISRISDLELEIIFLKDYIDFFKKENEELKKTISLYKNKIKGIKKD